MGCKQSTNTKGHANTNSANAQQKLFWEPPKETTSGGNDAATELRETETTTVQSPQQRVQIRPTFRPTSTMIGRGSFATVFLAFMDVAGSTAPGGAETQVPEKSYPVAVKEVRVPSDDDVQRAEVLLAMEKEFALLQSFTDCPQIVRVLHFEPPHPEEAPTRIGHESVARIYMELCKKGSLHALRCKRPNGRLHELTARAYLVDALRGLQYLHSHDVIHRDVKPQNILLAALVEDAFGTAFPRDVSPESLKEASSSSLSSRRVRRTVSKLSDFGSSRWTIAGADGGVCKTTQNVVGTAPYMSPESVRGKFSFASDIWAFGISFLELVTQGGDVWAHLGARDGFGLILKIGLLQEPNHVPPIPAHCSRKLRELLRSCFEMDYRRRPTAEELLRSDYFAQPLVDDDVEAVST